MAYAAGRNSSRRRERPADVVSGREGGRRLKRVPYIRFLPRRAGNGLSNPLHGVQSAPQAGKKLSETFWFLKSTPPQRGSRTVVGRWSREGTRPRAAPTPSSRGDQMR